MKKANSLEEAEVATRGRYVRLAACGRCVRRRWVVGFSGYGRRSVLGTVVVAVRHNEVVLWPDFD